MRLAIRRLPNTGGIFGTKVAILEQHGGKRQSGETHARIGKKTPAGNTGTTGLAFGAHGVVAGFKIV